MKERSGKAAPSSRRASLPDQMHDALLVIDSRNRIEYMNPAAYRYYEIDPDEPVVGTRFGDLFKVEWQDARQQSDYARSLRETGVWKGEHIHVTRTGRRVWTESVVSLRRDEAGRPAGVVAVLRDVAHRKQAEAALQERLGRLQLANEAAGVGTWSFDPKTRLAEWDAITRRHWGLSSTEPLVYTHLLSRIHPEDVPAFHAAVRRLSAEVTTCTLDIRVFHPDGSIHHLTSTGRRVTDETGEVVRFIGTSVDTTEQKKAEQALRHYADGLSFLSETALELMRPLGFRDLYTYIVERVYALADGAIVLFNEFDPKHEQTILRAIGATDDEKQTAARAFGREFIGLTLDFPEPIRERMIRGELTLVEGGVCDLAFYQLPQSICESLERELHIGNIYAMPCSVARDILGTVAVVTHDRGELRNKNLIESTVNQAGLALRRKRAEETLRNERNFFDTVLNTQGAIVAILGSNYEIVRLNRAYYEISKYPDDSMTGRFFWEVMDISSVRAVRRQLKALIQTNSTGEHDSLVTVKTGGTRTIRWRMTALPNEEGKIDHIIATGIDISDRIDAERKIKQLNTILRRHAQELEYANQRLDQLTMEDPLTGIANRRFLDTFVAREWPRAQREGHRVSLLMVDIDSFKAYNDLYGHPRGDECLRKVARQLAHNARRPSDVVARIGGEEFAVLLLDTDQPGAHKLAEEMRESIVRLQIPHGRSTAAGIVTVSIGVATVEARAGEFETLVDLADDALYRAKSAGRNRVESASLQ